MPKKQPHPNAIQLTVQSALRSARFYREKLGFRLAEAHPSKDRPTWACMVMGDQAVMLAQLPSLDDARRIGLEHEEIELLKSDAKNLARGKGGLGVHYFVQVEDVDAFHRKLKRKRVKPLTAPRTRSHGWREFQVEDLDGYRLVFYAEAGDAAAATTAPSSAE